MYVVFVDLAKGLDMVGRAGLLKAQKSIGYPPLLKIFASFHVQMEARVFFTGAVSDCFLIKCRDVGWRFLF